MGVLPFLYRAQLVEQGGAPVADAEAVPVSVWPARADRQGRAGMHADHTGEAAAAYHDQLREPNRSLVIAQGPMAGTYKITAATRQPFVPHVQLELTSSG